MNTFVTIMAGGGGTRLWPLSRRKKPKQFLNLSGREVMINETIDRFSKIVDTNNLFIVSNIEQKKELLSIIKDRCKQENIFYEPTGRNTSACICYSAFKLLKKYGDGIMIVSPSDAFIKDEKEFCRIIKKGIRLAEKTSKIITIGIKPTYAATRYGYIQFSNETEEVKKVISFTEKPQRETAEKYLKANNFAWNSGVFIWKISTILELIKEHLPDIYSMIRRISEHFGLEDEQIITNEIYPKIQSISIDYGVIEKTNEILTLIGDFGWNDIGSLDMIEVFHQKNNENNILVGECETLDSNNSIIYSTHKMIATIGIDELIIIETDNVILVCSKASVQDVGKMVVELEKKNKNKYL